MDWPMCEKETITFTKASPDHTLLKQIWPWFTSKILISMQVAKAFGHSWGDRVLDIHLPAQVGFVTLSHYGITAVFINHVEPILEASRKEWSWHIPTQVAIGQSDLCKKQKAEAHSRAARSHADNGHQKKIACWASNVTVQVLHPALAWAHGWVIQYFFLCRAWHIAHIVKYVQYFFIETKEIETGLCTSTRAARRPLPPSAQTWWLEC
jgi:hypothetical protein